MGVGCMVIHVATKHLRCCSDVNSMPRSPHIKPSSMNKYSTALLGTLLASGLATSAGSSMAQESPNIVGSWTGRSSTILVDGPNYSSATMPSWENPKIQQRDVTAKITHQKGNLFWGKVYGNGKLDGPMIGAIGVDGKTLVLVGPNAHARATLVSPTQIEYCYLDSDMASGDKSYKAGCSMLTKR